MPKIGRPPGAPAQVPSRPAEAPKAGETAMPRTSPSDHSTFASGPAKATAKPAAQAQGTLGLPITTVLPGADRMTGAVGAGIAYQLAQLWKRQPGEKRIPKKALKTVMERLPKGPQPRKGEQLEDDEVTDYCNSLPRRHARGSKQLMSGMSGAQVFEVDDAKGPGEGAIFKVFCTAEEMLQDVAGLEVIAALKGHPLRPVAVEHAGEASDGKRGFVVMEKAKGTVIYDRMDQLAAATGPERERLLKLLCAELRLVGAALAGFHESGRSMRPVPESYKKLALSRVRGLWATACEKNTRGRLLDPATRKHIEGRLRALAKDFMLAPLQATVCIGDVHPGNVAVHDGRVSVFDVSTLVASLGADGKGIAPSADDRVWFAETIPWYARKVKLTAAEGKAAYDAFLEAYRAASPLAADPADAAAVRLFRARSAMMDLRFNADSDEELDRALVALGGASKP